LANLPHGPRAGSGGAEAALAGNPAGEGAVTAVVEKRDIVTVAVGDRLWHNQIRISKDRAKPLALGADGAGSGVATRIDPERVAFLAADAEQKLSIGLDKCDMRRGKPVMTQRLLGEKTLVGVHRWRPMLPMWARCCRLTG